MAQTSKAGAVPAQAQLMECVGGPQQADLRSIRRQPVCCVCTVSNTFSFTVIGPWELSEKRVFLEKERKVMGTGYTLGLSLGLMWIGFVGVVSEVLWDCKGKLRRRVRAPPVIPAAFFELGKV